LPFLSTRVNGKDDPPTRARANAHGPCSGWDSRALSSPLPRNSLLGHNMNAMKPIAPYPSIFNDVIGPVMRGPSSSHCAASLRIGRIARDLMGGNIEEVLVQFDPGGSIARTHESQGSDMGLFAGFLGWEAADERLTESRKALEESGVEARIEIAEFQASHPNTYKLVLKNAEEQHQMTALSTGGGMIEVIEIDGAEVSIRGDYFETLVFLDSAGQEAVHFLSRNMEADDILLFKEGRRELVEIKAQRFMDSETASGLRSRFPVRSIKTLPPLLPILSRKNMHVPFITCEGMIRFNKGKDLSLWELAILYESARGRLSGDDVYLRMRDLVGIMDKSIHEGIQGTEYRDRILGHQSGKFLEQMNQNRLLDAGILNRMILFVTAMMEAKSAMGVIVAAPTAGSCGALPGACLGAAFAMGLSTDDMTRAMLAAGLIGIFISANATFAAEVGGCQAECGSGSAMAAAALVSLARGTAQQAVDAASMALQNVLGMICDPVANRVEVPCLGKNVLAASNALACANMALAGFDTVIPLDEVIETMDRVGKGLPPELRCTALGGLSITPTAKKIERTLQNRGTRR
jgi:L-serine dehydratase